MAEFKKLTAPPTPTEHDQQVEFIRWVHQTREAIPALKSLTAVPNQGGLGKSAVVRGAKMVAEGLSPGYPDLLLDVARGGYFGWRCEMKREKPRGVVSEEQAAWHARLRAAGYYVCVTYTAEETRQQVLSYLGLPNTPTRTT